MFFFFLISNVYLTPVNNIFIAFTACLQKSSFCFIEGTFGALYRGKCVRVFMYVIAVFCESYVRQVQCVCVCVVCVCVCVRERDSLCMYVCVCLCEK